MILTEPTYLGYNRSVGFRRIDRYIMAEIASYFTGSCAVFFLIFLMFQLLRLAESLIVHKVPIAIVTKIAGLLLISFSHFTFPTAFLAGSLMAFGRLSSDAEFNAMRSIGVGPPRMALAAFVPALIVTLLTLVTSFFLAPWGEREMTVALYTVGSRKATSALHSRTFVEGFYDLLLYADEVDPKTGMLERVFIYDNRQAESPVIVVGQQGRLQTVQTQNVLASQIALTLYNGSTLRMASRGRTLPISTEKAQFQTYTLYLKIEANTASAPDLPRMASFPALIERVRTSPPGSHVQHDFANELWRRVSVALSPLFFGFIGLGLGTIPARSTASKGIIIALLLALFYWQSLMISASISDSGLLPPWAAMQLPSVLMGLAAFFSYRRVRR